MGFIEEGRQLIQDFVTPEIRLIDVRLTALEKRVESFEAKADKRFDAVETKIETVQTKLEKKIDDSHNQVMESLRRIEIYNQILERPPRVESKIQNVA